MALFFDKDWFDARLAALGLAHATLAAALGVSAEALAEIWKDQRELSARDVTIMAALLAVPAEDVARHAGISTPVPGPEPSLAGIAERLDRIEQQLAALVAALRERR